VTRPVRLLLVEDNPGDVCLTLEALAEGTLKPQVAVADDGLAALDRLHGRGEHHAEPHPDLILLDLNLPGKDGREVLEEIKQDPRLRSIPVVVLTSSEAEEDVRRCYDLHANCYIVKPVDFQRFARVVRSIEDFWFQRAVLPGRIGE